MKNYKDIYFSCNTQDERFGLTQNLNSEEREEFQSKTVHGSLVTVKVNSLLTNNNVFLCLQF